MTKRDGITYNCVPANALKTSINILLETFHVPLPCLIVAIGAAVNDETPFVEPRVYHGPDRAGKRLARPVELFALGNEPFKLVGQHCQRHVRYLLQWRDEERDGKCSWGTVRIVALPNTT